MIIGFYLCGLCVFVVESPDIYARNHEQKHRGRNIKIKMTVRDAYQDCLNEMYGLRRFGIKLGLETIKRILRHLGNPQDDFRCIHIAGTNGKGSVASMLASILKTCGYKTGLYTSPHLVRFNERISINGYPIPDDRVIASYNKIKKLQFGGREPTFFEFTTAMALYEFSRQQVDWAVIETGMGGRLDATNVIQPSLSIITNISVEHREYLGNTIREIATEKAGIIKSNTPVITGVRQKDAIEAIERAAAERSAEIYRLGKDLKVRRGISDTFTYFGLDHIWRNLQTGLTGSHQVDNAALVLAACELLGRDDSKVAQPQIQSGLQQTNWPGRLEIVSTDPHIILDGAHNLKAARNLSQYLASRMAPRDITLVIGILDDKPYRAMLESLVPVCRKVIVTQPKINRRLPADTLLQVVKELTDRVTALPDVEQAVIQAVQSCSPSDAICIAGSLYVVGEAKAALEKRSGSQDQKQTNWPTTPAGN